MKKEAIRKTAVVYWSDEDECFVVESPLLPITAGIGDSEEAALRHFDDMLDITYDELKADNVIGYKRGRPTKGGVEFHSQVQPDTKKSITELAEKLGVSQGEAVDYLAFYHSKKQQSKPVTLILGSNTNVYDLKRVIDIAVSERTERKYTTRKAESKSAASTQSAAKHTTVSCHKCGNQVEVPTPSPKEPPAV